MTGPHQGHESKAGISETDRARAASAAAELVEHVDIAGQVLAVVPRAHMRQELLRHRCTYVAVVDSAQRLVVHQRANWKDVYPGWWDVAFGGICGVGEDWDAAARRELEEEAGLRVELEYLGTRSYQGDDGAVVGRVYVAKTDAEPTCPDGEVIAIDRVSLDHLDQWLDGRSVCLDSLAVVLPLLNNS